jgi:hypothetical protein
MAKENIDLAFGRKKRTGNVRVTSQPGAFLQPLSQWKSDVTLYNLSECVCSLCYPACNTHAPGYHLWPAPLYNNFPHYLINGTIFEKKKKKVTKNKLRVSSYFELNHFSF